MQTIYRSIYCTFHFIEVICKYLMENEKLNWVKPEVNDLGQAKDLIRGLNPVFDSKTSLTPEDEFNTTTS